MYSIDLKLAKIHLEANKERKKLFINVFTAILIGIASVIIGIGSLIYSSMNNVVNFNISLNFIEIMMDFVYLMIICVILLMVMVLWSISQDVARIQVIEHILDYRKVKFQ